MAHDYKACGNFQCHPNDLSTKNSHHILSLYTSQSNVTKHVLMDNTTGWHTRCHTVDCAHNTFLLLQKHLTSGTELILIGWKIVPNEEHVRCDHRFASQPLANEPLHSSQLFDTSLQKAHGTTSLCGAWAALHFLAFSGLLWRLEKARKCSAAHGPHKRWSHGTCSSLGTIFQPMRINSVPDVKSVIIKMCYVHNQWYDISCATL